MRTQGKYLCSYVRHWVSLFKSVSSKDRFDGFLRSYAVSPFPHLFILSPALFFHLFTLSLPPSFSPCTNPSLPVLFHLSSISLSSLSSSFLPSFHPVSPTPQVPPPLQCSLSRSFMWRCSAGTWSSSLPSCWFTPRLRWAGCCSLCAVWTLRTRQWRWDSSLWLLVCWVSAVVYLSSVKI